MDSEPSSEPPKWKPFFHLSNIFAQSFGLSDSVRCLQQPDSVCRAGTVEDCNFTKAALRFSDGLSKDQLSTALRLVIQTIGESMRIRSNTVVLDFDVGRLSFGNGYASFTFRKNLKDLTGCPGDLDLSTYLTTKTGVSSSNRSSSNLPPRSVSTPSSRRTRSVVSTKQDKVLKAALSRHLEELESKAQGAIHAREEWKSLMKASEQEGKNEEIARRNEARKNLMFVMDQIRDNESKRMQDRKHTTIAASSHAFPQLAEAPPRSFKPEQIRTELDQQVRAAESARNKSRAEEAKIAQSMNENSRKELEDERERDASVKRMHRKLLSDAWTLDIRLKNCWKAIETMDVLPR